MYKKTLIFIFANISLSFFASQKNMYSVNPCNNSQQNVYLVSCFEKFREDRLYQATEELLNRGVDPNYRPGMGYLSPLMWAMKNNKQELAWLLLVKGANPDHVCSSLPAEKNKHYTHILPIIKDEKGRFLRGNAFMFGKIETRKWLSEYIEDFKARERRWANESKNNNSYIR